MINEQMQTPTCATWLTTEANLVAVGYTNGHVALFDVKSGTISSTLELSDSSIIAIAAHQFEDQIVVSTSD